MTFAADLDRRMRSANSLVCVGLDPVWSRLPPVCRTGRSVAEQANDVIRFNAAIIERTAAYAAAYKPNLAFYLPLGPDGIRALLETRRLIPDGIPVLLDAKVNDMSSTAEQYARAYFDEWGFDAVTVNAYLGYDSVKPFLDRGGKGVILVAHTSNPGSADFQELPVGQTGRELNEEIAATGVRWGHDAPGQIGFVVGATYPHSAARIRAIAPNEPILLPGVGAQAGDLAGAVRAGVNAHGRGLMVSASRSIMHASMGADFAEAAGAAARQLRDEANSYRAAIAV